MLRRTCVCFPIAPYSMFMIEQKANPALKGLSFLERSRAMAQAYRALSPKAMAALVNRAKKHETFKRGSGIVATFIDKAAPITRSSNGSGDDDGFTVVKRERKSRSAWRYSRFCNAIGPYIVDLPPDERVRYAARIFKRTYDESITPRQHERAAIALCKKQRAERFWRASVAGLGTVGVTVRPKRSKKRRRKAGNGPTLTAVAVSKRRPAVSPSRWKSVKGSSVKKSRLPAKGLSKRVTANASTSGGSKRSLRKDPSTQVKRSAGNAGHKLAVRAKGRHGTRHSRPALTRGARHGTPSRVKPTKGLAKPPRGGTPTKASARHTASTGAALYKRSPRASTKVGARSHSAVKKAALSANPPQGRKIGHRRSRLRSRGGGGLQGLLSRKAHRPRTTSRPLASGAPKHDGNAPRLRSKSQVGPEHAAPAGSLPTAPRSASRAWQGAPVKPTVLPRGYQKHSFARAYATLYPGIPGKDPKARAQHAMKAWKATQWMKDSPPRDRIREMSKLLQQEQQQCKASPSATHITRKASRA